MHLTKTGLVDLPPDLARLLITKGYAESTEQMVARSVSTPEPLRDRIATKGGGGGTDNHS